MKSITVLTTRYMLRTEGLEIYHVPPSVFDPSFSSRLAVRCQKHNKTIEFDTDEVNDSLPNIVVDAKRALATCQTCIDETAAIMPPTRWPEGAEL